MTLSTSRIISAASLLMIAAASLPGAAHCQQAATAPPQSASLLAANSPAEPPKLPDAPSYSSSLTSEDPQASGQSPEYSPAYEDDGKQTKRILGIFPNFRSVSANQHLPPQSVKEKFITATQDSFDYSSVFTPAVLAGYDQARNNTPEFHQGALGYGRYFWHSALDQTSENYFVEFIVPAITHEDTRYYTLGHGGFLKRGGYAIKHVVVTRNDAGKDTFNSGEVVGAALSAALSNAYYPSNERTFGNTAQQWGTSVGIDAFTFALREFWPDINHALFGGAKPHSN
jgi:hypothetical protein